MSDYYETDNNGDVRYYNSQGLLHRPNGPAVEYATGSKEWWVDGKRHRPTNEGPALYYVSGRKEYWVDGKKHRTTEEGPAVIEPDGRIEYWVNNRLHRFPGPAIVKADGKKLWFIEGKLQDPSKISFNTVKMFWDSGNREFIEYHMDNPRIASMVEKILGREDVEKKRLGTAISGTTELLPNLSGIISDYLYQGTGQTRDGTRSALQGSTFAVTRRSRSPTGGRKKSPKRSTRDVRRKSRNHRSR